MLRFARYRFNFEAIDSIHLPWFPGSALRGLLGHGLLRTVCVTNLRDCGECDLKRQCAYTYLFETHNFTGIKSGTALPLVLTLGRLSRDYQPGDSFSLELTLIGQSTRYFPYLIQAWQRAGRKGLGKENARFDLISIEYTNGEGGWLPLYPQRADHGFAPLSHLSSLVDRTQTVPSKVRIELLTPYRSKRDGRLVTPKAFDAGGFLISLIKRLENLRGVHDPEMPEPNTRELVAASGTIEMSDANLKWTDWTRHSSRQQTHMNMGGVTGSFTLGGDGLETLYPLLELGQWVHTGKNTLFGLGQYRLTVEDSGHG